MYQSGSQQEADDILEWDNWEELTSGFFFLMLAKLKETSKKWYNSQELATVRNSYYGCEGKGEPIR